VRVHVHEHHGIAPLAHVEVQVPVAIVVTERGAVSVVRVPVRERRAAREGLLDESSVSVAHVQAVDVAEDARDEEVEVPVVIDVAPGRAVRVLGHHLIAEGCVRDVVETEVFALRAPAAIAVEDVLLT